MPIEIEVREIPPQRWLVKKTTCAHTEIGPAFTKAIQSVTGAVAQAAARVTSPPIAIYLAWRQADTDMAVGFAVDRDIENTEGCEWLDAPSGTHVVATHIGPYTMLHQTHAAIGPWCDSRNLKLTGACWESYPVGPDSEPDSSKWHTLVHYPVAL